MGGSVHKIPADDLLRELNEVVKNWRNTSNAMNTRNRDLCFAASLL
jgi:hypothetical protein